MSGFIPLVNGNINTSQVKNQQTPQVSTPPTPDTLFTKLNQTAFKALELVNEGGKTISDISGITDIITGVRQANLHQFAKGLGKAGLSTAFIGAMVMGVSNYNAGLPKQEPLKMDPELNRINLREHSDYESLPKICCNDLDCISKELNAAIEYQSQNNIPGTQILQTAEQLESEIIQHLNKPYIKCFDDQFDLHQFKIEPYSIVTGLNTDKTKNTLFKKIEFSRANDNSYIKLKDIASKELQVYGTLQGEKYCSKYAIRESDSKPELKSICEEFGLDCPEIGDET